MGDSEAFATSPRACPDTDADPEAFATTPPNPPSLGGESEAPNPAEN